MFIRSEIFNLRAPTLLWIIVVDLRQDLNIEEGFLDPAHYALRNHHDNTHETTDYGEGIG